MFDNFAKITKCNDDYLEFPQQIQVTVTSPESKTFLSGSYTKRNESHWCDGVPSYEMHRFDHNWAYIHKVNQQWIFSPHDECSTNDFATYDFDKNNNIMNFWHNNYAFNISYYDFGLGAIATKEGLFAKPNNLGYQHESGDYEIQKLSSGSWAILQIEMGFWVNGEERLFVQEGEPIKMLGSARCAPGDFTEIKVDTSEWSSAKCHCDPYNICNNACVDSPEDNYVCQCVPMMWGDQCFSCPPGKMFERPDSGTCVSETCAHMCTKTCTDTPHDYNACKCIDNGWGPQCHTCPPGKDFSAEQSSVCVSADCMASKIDECNAPCLQNPNEYGDCTCIADHSGGQCHTCPFGQEFDETGTCKTPCPTNKEELCYALCNDWPDDYGACQCFSNGDCPCDQCVQCEAGMLINDNRECYWPSNCYTENDEECAEPCLDHPDVYGDCKCKHKSEGDVCLTCPAGQVFVGNTEDCIGAHCDQYAQEMCYGQCNTHPDQYGECGCFSTNGTCPCDKCLQCLPEQQIDSNEECYYPSHCPAQMDIDCQQPCIDMY